MPPTTLQLDASFFFSVIAVVIGIYSSIAVFFVKREIASLDAVKKIAYENAGDIQIINTELKQLGTDIEKSNAKADDIVNNYKSSFKELNIKVDALMAMVSTIRITCAGHLAREGAEN